MKTPPLIHTPCKAFSPKRPIDRAQIEALEPLEEQTSKPVQRSDKTSDELEDMIDLGLDLTFPASDPPAWKRASTLLTP
jgi:hypothetical protein